ncbi:MAG: UDP-N-acetylmuramate--L-alanine ligase [Candidatus Symbiobacter sp.]|nr:UDP-N-acetylmuramate--L-alanine ligase [Candidatus Symbiobacter sp.]
MKIRPELVGSIHFVGIGGIGMSGIAEILHGLGYQVGGSDLAMSANVQRLRDKGIKIAIGHHSDNIAGAKLLVVTSAATAKNPEIIAARAQRIPIIRRAEMLAELMRLKMAVAVAGTHGKTTTTSMAAVMMEQGGADPTVINGGVINQYGSNAYLGRGDWIVVEADESDGTFVRLPSTIGIITNIDPEHMEHFGSFDRVIEAFYTFAANLPFYGFAVMCHDHEVVRSLLPRLEDRRVFTYGLENVSEGRADLYATKVVYSGQGTQFDVVISHRLNQAATGGQSPSKITGLQLNMLGKHNLSNALAVVAMGLGLGFGEGVIRQAVAKFTGVKRRFTKTGEVGGVTVIDDYGHHPVEIKAVLAAARLACPRASKKRIIAVAQPHRYTRLRDLMDDFAQCFDDADEVILADVYAAGEEAIAGVSSDALLQAMNKLRPKLPVAKLPRPEDLAAMIAARAKAGDYVVCLGAGSITQWAHGLPQQLAALPAGLPENLMANPTRLAGVA